MKSKEYFKSLSILWAALVAGQIFFAAIVYYLHKSGNFAVDENLNRIFLVIVPAFVVVGIAGNILFFKAKLKQLKFKKDLSYKMEQYRVALLVSYALIEGPSILGIVAFLLTGNIVFLSLSILIILLFFVNKPSKYKFSLDLELSGDEKKLIEIEE
ncbi:MAG TPA: hypothetical protein DDX39_01455 [Bacteroidales bacterium]|nr:MAG: hypothetical protein A2W98_07670 [Bacteroidetes bacterium GWF2_33_38]OFY76538.1 MAG: hypothetical protein A2265_10955 [Bacteroidetes bacterium RIFOXYA12_FULL_33_9]OFY88111.1 MAG: hypothetical protein A2236_13035 [Bacteroidetes bacterium RIFOXYA2_FULL_33_7]HBF87278.1 hypothetical protein [Bacteroidales bacterium]